MRKLPHFHGTNFMGHDSHIFVCDLRRRQEADNGTDHAFFTQDRKSLQWCFLKSYKLKYIVCILICMGGHLQGAWVENWQVNIGKYRLIYPLKLWQQLPAFRQRSLGLGVGVGLRHFLFLGSLQALSRLRRDAVGSMPYALPKRRPSEYNTTSTLPLI